MMVAMLEFNTKVVYNMSTCHFDEQLGTITPSELQPSFFLQLVIPWTKGRRPSIQAIMYGTFFSNAFVVLLLPSTLIHLLSRD
jgi:hypothetical protein